MDFVFFKTVVLLLGSNMGDRIHWLTQASIQLQAHVGALYKASTVYQTAPWGKTDQPPFLNQALRLQTTLEPLDILTAALEIETALGRTRDQPWGPRTIDIDLLCYEDHIHDCPRLTLPHDHLTERRFALLPLQAVYPDWIHPQSQQNLEQMIAQCSDTLPVLPYSPRTNETLPLNVARS
ncbi:MAG: 2-amino-4-hydroxy-6-hydroxymethyldihydropteridine diphosphokinase [Bernardetiaceae bacterium]